MSWLLALALDHVPWWLWAVLLAGAAAATWHLWRPFWALLPTPLKTALVIIATGGLAYLAGRNRGAAGALQRAKEREQARADDINDTGAAARARADRDAMDGRLYEDDGWRRKD